MTSKRVIFPFSRIKKKKQKQKAVSTVGLRMYLIHTTEIFDPTNNYFYIQNK